jgi:spore maturation protein CgeB
MRQYRLVRLAGLHYLGEEMYRGNSRLLDMSFEQQQKTLFAEAYVYSNGMTSALSRLGHEVHEVVYDLKPMQETWAREHGIQYRPESWQTDILLKQIERLRPDVLYFQDIHSMPHELRKQLKTLYPFIRLIVVHSGFPGEFKKLDDVDLLLVAMPSMMRKYREEGLDAQLMYHAFDDRIHDKLVASGYSQNSYLCDFSYVGSSGFGHHYHVNRYWDLLRLMEQTNIRMWLDEQDRCRIQTRDFLLEIGYQGDVDQMAMAVVGLNQILPDAEQLRKKLPQIQIQIQKAVDTNRLRQGFPLRNLQVQYPHRVHPPVFGLKMYDLLRRSKICFNNHMTRSWGSVGNLRMYEATGMGTCLVTDTGDNMQSLFEPDREVVTYNSMDECIEKVRYLLDHEDVRRQIGLAGQRRTLQDHTMNNRSQQVDSLIQAMLNRGRSIQSIPAVSYPRTTVQPVA